MLVKIGSEGPVFYGQERVGRDGKPFRIWKFRTMHQGAEDILEDYLEAHPQLKGEWQRTNKLSRDPRARTLRRHVDAQSSLDELPQLWNVLKGEMSLVGPRPLPVYHLEKFDEPFRHYRETVLPGITGVWQVSSRGNGELASYITSDEYYIRNWSLWLDTTLLARTAMTVLSGRGAS